MVRKSPNRLEIVTETPPRTSDRSSLIDERFDHDSCGVGFVAAIDGVATHQILRQALTALSRLAHRGATAADGRVVMVLV